MTLTPTQFGNITNLTRHTGWRYKILKTAASGGKAVPAPGSGYETLKCDFAGTGGYDYQTAVGSYKQVIRDTTHHRNRTIILHDVGLQIPDPAAVVSIINHIDDSIVMVNVTTSAGWPTSYILKPKGMLFDAEGNYLYVSIGGEGTHLAPGTPPAVLKINLEDAGDSLATCATMTDNADFLASEDLFLGDTDLTGDSGYYELLGIHGGRIYAFFHQNTNGTNAYWTPFHFGYFIIATGAFQFLWANGTWADPTPDTRIVLFNMAWANDGTSPCYQILRSADFDPETHLITMGFSPVAYLPAYSVYANAFGWEASLMDLNILEAIDHSADRVTTYRIHRSMQVDTIYNALSGFFQYNGCLDPNHTFDSEHIDCSAFSTGMVEITYTWTAPDITKLVSVGALGASIHFETGAESYSFAVAGPVTGAGTPDGTSQMKPGTYQESLIIALDPANPYLDIYVGVPPTVTIEYSATQSTNYEVYIREFPYGAKHAANVLSAVPVRQLSDNAYPGTQVPFCSTSESVKKGTTSGSIYTEAMHLAKIGSFYAVAMYDNAAAGLGLWLIRDDGEVITRQTVASSDLIADKVRAIIRAGAGAALIASGTSIQLYDVGDAAFTWGANTIEFLPATGANPILGLAFDGDWITCWNSEEIWWFTPGGTRAAGGDGAAGAPWRRSPRVWWDGNDPDVIVGAGANVDLDSRGRAAGFISDGFRHSKGEASYELTFSAQDVNYLPWVDSTFNENAGAPGSYAGTLEHGNRILLERGIRDDQGLWEWLPECQTFIVSEPGDVAGGIATLAVTAKGIIGTLLTRSVYEMTHRPTEAVITAGAMTAVAGSGGETWQYEIGGDAVHDWAKSPEPIITVGGVTAHGFTMNTAAGTATFTTDMTATPPSASFTYYVPGTNEAEDIILCILQHPNQIGGADLDTSWFTRSITGETLTTADDLTYSFSKNMVVSGHAGNIIYVDGVPTGAGFTWDARMGTVTFGLAQTGNVITGDCRYYTIQASGITLREITFSPKTQANAYDVINEVVRRVAPNYIFHEDSDGKLIADYYTQKAPGAEDVVIEDDDVVLTRASDNPMYFDLATYVISYGQAPLSELPNLALGKLVTDVWSYAWGAGSDVQSVTDGDPATQAWGGFGRWAQGTKTVQDALIAAGDDGLPLVYVDLESVLEVETIILARGSQVATEGDGGAVCEYSVWISSNGTDWKRIVNRFNIPPGQNVQFKAGTNFDVGTTFQYIRVNLHSLGLYQWKGHTDSQFGLSEIQCFESEIIKGIAQLQDTDPTAPFYDEWGLLARYDNHLVNVARNGQPDPALYTQERVQADAENTLNEMMRLLSQVELAAAYLPGVKLFDTVKVINGALQRTVTMFVENKNVSPSGDTFMGNNLP